MHILVNAIIWIARVVFAIYFYDVAISLAGLLPFRRPLPAERKLTFAILVCAHDEARVVSGVVKSVLEQEYPKELFVVFVIADNCSDLTADIARAAGATVLERTNARDRTKGYALQWGMSQVIEGNQSFDALCVLDADNVVPSDFLAVMNDHLGCGEVAIQSYLDTKNPNDTWVTRCIAFGYYVTNRFWLRPRSKLGISATLGGTGFCLSAKVVEKYRWFPASLADDLELTMQLIRDGVRVFYTPHTRTYDEKPLTLSQSFRQRSRWMQGHNDVAVRWLGPMLLATLKRGSWGCFDAVMHLLQPLRLLLLFCALAFLLTTYAMGIDASTIKAAFPVSLPAFGMMLSLFLVYPLLIAKREGKGGFAIRTMLPSMVFAFTWIPAILLGLLRIRRRVWVHTAHGLQGSKNDGGREGPCP